MAGNRKAVLLVALTAFLWSTGGLAIKLIDWPGMAIGGTRSAIAALVMYLALGRPKITLGRNQIILAACYAGTVVSFVVANKMTTAANAILLQYTAPAWVALLAPRFLNERNRRVDYVCIGTVLVGMTLFFFEKLSPGHLSGNILSIVSGMLFAGMIVTLRKQKDARPVESIILGNIFAFLMCVPWIATAPLPDAQSVAGIVYLGTVQLGLSYAIYSWAIQHVRAVDAVLISSLEPLMNPLWVFLFVGEAPSIWAIFGGLLILIAVTVKAVYGSKVALPSREQVGVG